MKLWNSIKGVAFYVQNCNKEGTISLLMKHQLILK